MTDRDKLIKKTDRDVRRLEQKERAPMTKTGIAFYGGTVGLLFIVPLVLGSYLGRWLDSICSGYSVRWTVSGIVLGIVLGAYNAYTFMRSRS